MTRPKAELYPTAVEKQIELENKYLKALEHGADFSVLKDIKTEIRLLKDAVYPKRCRPFHRLGTPKDKGFF